MPITYTTISDYDKKLIAADRLRGLEADHYRLVMTGLADGVDDQDIRDRLRKLEEQIPKVQEELASLGGAP